MKTLLFVFGTRPEAIKLCPLIHHLRLRHPFRVLVCVTAQHRSLLDQVLQVFDVHPDFDLNLMQPRQTLSELTARMMTGLEPVLTGAQPDMVLVQGDTASTLCGSLAAFYQRVPVAHVEAGLRTGDLAHPFPEEANRVLTGRLATLHFPPTEGAADNLRREGVPASQITVTGNTGIDALLEIQRRLEDGSLPAVSWPWPDDGRKLVLVTSHRRESFGSGIEQICQALTELAHRPDTRIAFPVHPNPQVEQAVRIWLEGRERVHLLEPQPYVPFVDLMRRAHLILTDSGGVQEEAPSLGKPVLVMREKTERPEAVEAGTSRLVGTSRQRIVEEASLLLDDTADYERRSRMHNPYGDGRASERIGECLMRYFDGR